jgi:hypothetical protein
MIPDSFFTLVLRRIAWRHAVPWLLRGLAAGAVAATLVLLIARLVPLAIAQSAIALCALGAGVALAVAGASMAWLRRPAPDAAVRRADRLLGLCDRLTTAWEYAGGEAPILRLQRADLAAQAEHVDVRRDLPLTPSRREAVAPAVGTAVLLAVLLLPNPQDRVLAVRTTTHARIAHATAHVAQAQRSTGTLPRATLATLPKADRLRQLQLARVLARLQHQLAAARTSAQALKAIAQAQDALKRLANTQAAAQQAALSALASSLLRSAATRPLAKALRQGNPASIAAAMRNLAARLAHMSAAQRADVARTMQAAANAAARDPSLSQALQNAATALAQQDTSAAQSALAAAGRQAAADAARAGQQTALNAANTALDNARNDVSGLSTSTSGSPSGRRAGGAGSGKPGQGTAGAGRGAAQTGQGKGQGAGRGNGKGQGQGAGQGNGKGQGGKGQGTGNGKGQGGKGQGTGNGKGQGQGTGQGQGQGAGVGQGQGSGSTAGQGQGGGNGGGGARGGNGGNGSAASGQKVYIPGPQGQGPSSTTNGTPSAPAGGSPQPWRSVLPAYERAARASLENSALPPDQRALVKRYFDQLSH